LNWRLSLGRVLLLLLLGSEPSEELGSILADFVSVDSRLEARHRGHKAIFDHRLRPTHRIGSQLQALLFFLGRLS